MPFKPSYETLPFATASQACPRWRIFSLSFLCRSRPRRKIASMRSRILRITKRISGLIDAIAVLDRSLL